ncbi:MULTISPECIES: hypothetical protein [Bacillus cereus group]|uniref:hypothetical protein n=1 Tax=Bacillus cereus group TaxID=86661 RepID=UPI0007727ED8|nr:MULTISPECIES: hypothetical protein [Bacillus cereus group]KXI77932.1 hypothetical protein ACS52_13530 [Bacillus cereus]MBL3844663.1 hypothetical protein [Bacillus cereus]MCU5160269.1 hypothetical protein [Bacillus pacificus]MCU9945706.1 hypothetical protein [Bacillus pacificus]MCW4576531.1 hypothetical protein [Bacillus pacificus]
MDKVFVLELLEDNNESEVYGVFKNEAAAETAGKEMVASTENYFWEFVVTEYELIVDNQNQTK